MSDQALAAKAAAGSREAFALLLERHYDHIYRLAWRMCGSRAAAEDVAQDVCVKLATAIRSFRGDSAFSTWVWRITYTTATDRLRATQRTTMLEPSQIMALVDSTESGGASQEDAVAGAELWAAVRELPGQQRDAVLLVYGEDMSHAEAAEVMGCSEKTVSWHLHEARKRLRSKLEAAG